MHRIEALIAGIRGAENGYVQLFQRGTSSRATWYTDFEASSSNSSGDNIQLDSYGSAVVFVDQPVLVLAFASGGTKVREWVAGTAASAVEVRSTSFLGQNYETAAEDVSQPTTLESVLDRFVLSFGAADANVLFRDADEPLQDALALVDSGFYNVLGPAFGAVGNGVANDAAAIQSALNAAGDAGGGIVFLGPGTYRVQATLNVPQNVSLVGSGPGNTILRLDHATADLINFSAKAVRGSTIEGIAFDVAQAASGHLIEITQADTRLTVRNCRFIPTAAALTGVCITSGLLTGLQVRIDDCHFAPNSVAANAITLQRGSPVIIGCQFVAPAGIAANQMVRADGEGAIVAFCRFDLTAVNGGTVTGVLASNNLTAGRPCVVIGNSFTGVAGGSGVAWQLNATSGNGAAESGNVLAAGLLTQILGAWTATSNEVSDGGSWEKRILGVSLGATTTYTISEDHGQVNITTTGAGMTVTMPTVRVGQTLRILWHNNNAGVQSFNVAAGAWRSAMAFPNSVNANAYIVLHCHGVAVNGANYWQIALVADDMGE
jgi:hypothetical protein